MCTSRSGRTPLRVRPPPLLLAPPSCRALTPPSFAAPKPARRFVLPFALFPERPEHRSTSFALEGPSDRIAAFVRQLDGGAFAFRGGESGVDEAEVIGASLSLLCHSPFLSPCATS